MSAANEVAEVNTFNWARLVTSSTTRALCIVYGGEVVDKGYGALGAFFGTETAAYAAVLTDLTNLGALVMIVTLYYYTLGIIDEMNYAVGAFLYAKTTADTLSRIDLGNIFLGIYADRVSRTNLHTIAVAKAGEGTVSVAREEEISALAGRRTRVNVFSLFILAGAVTGNISNLFNNVSRLKSHYRGYLASYSVTTGNTKSSLGRFALGESLCVTVATRKAARAAIRAGQTLTYRRSSLILLHAEEHRGDGKKNGAK